MKLKNIISNKGNILRGSKILYPKILNDQRGCFFESWNKSLLDKNLEEKIDFVQDNQSRSKFGVIRGLHYQITPKAQNKLISCISGEIFDVVVDIRKNSPTFGEWGGVKLNDSNNLMIWVPSGFAHGFLSLKNETIVSYKVSEYWSKNHEKTIRWNDKEININWPFNEINYFEPILSQKDANSPYLREAELFI